jgi:serine/threonine-protein kinase
VFSIQDEIASNIVDALTLKIGQQERPHIKRSTENPKAYHLYLKGRHFWHHRQPEMQRRALKAYQQAKEMDPSFALAHAGISWIHTVMGLYGLMPPGRAYSEAEAAAKKALEIDDMRADVQIAPWGVHFCFTWQWHDAERAIQRSIQLEPNHVDAHCFYALQLASMGRDEEALKEMSRAQELDPLSPYANTLAGMVLLRIGQDESAVLELQKALDIDPDFVIALNTIGGAYVRLSQYDQAISILERANAMTGRAPFHTACLGWAYGKAGKSDEARAVLNELKERMAKEYVSPLYISWVLSELKEEGDAFEWLEKAFEERNPYLAFWKVPFFDSLRSDPRFESLLRRENLLT